MEGTAGGFLWGSVFSSGATGTAEFLGGDTSRPFVLWELMGVMVGRPRGTGFWRQGHQEGGWAAFQNLPLSPQDRIFLLY